MKKGITLAIVGATGLVGSYFISILNELDLPISNIRLYASIKSKGRQIKFKDKTYFVEELSNADLNDIDYALFSAGQDVAETYIPIFVNKGIKVIDNSSFFRMKKDVPLVVPEINFEDISKDTMLIANPNCSTIQSIVPLYFINREFGLKKIYYSTYQSVSGSGIKGIFDLESAIEGYPYEFYEVDISKYCYPLIGEIDESGYSKEETKMVNESKKILKNDNLDIEATCVRVPIKYGHGVSIIFETEKEIQIQELIKIFKKNSILKYHDKISFPEDVTKDDYIHLMRFRLSKVNSKRGMLYCFSNYLRKGAALNAVQILQRLLES